MLNAHCIGDHHCAAADRQGGQTNLHQCGNEWQAAAIKDWCLTTVDCDQGIINAKTRKGSHQMFNCLKPDTLGIFNARAKAGFSDIIGAGGNCLAVFGDINTLELDAAIRRGRVNREMDKAS
jgi:hypothetical protein